MNEILTDPTVRVYAICATILVLKMLLTGTATGMLRMGRHVYITPEDYTLMGQTARGAPDETIERIRRAHQNDVENILPFLVIGFLYALSGPSHAVALGLFSAFTGGRILHTLAYAAGMQPWRTIFFTVAVVALVTMAVHVLIQLA